MKLGSIRFYKTDYKCTNDRKIVTCMVKNYEYSKLKLKDMVKNTKLQIYNCKYRIRLPNNNNYSGI